MFTNLLILGWYYISQGNTSVLINSIILNGSNISLSLAINPLSTLINKAVIKIGSDKSVIKT